MKSLSYKHYFDKVYGCFLGKCVGGTAGGPAEGRKELLDAPLNEEMLHVALPNDDLDLQILWLELLEEKGVHITARDMAEEFYHKVPYGPGEYAYFKKNYGRGIDPPVSGCFNNRYYKNGMGCPIRSEIWACLFPGAPELTKHYVDMDGSLDHERDSISAEYFLASVESEAFFAQSVEEIPALLKRGLARLDPDSRIARLLADTMGWYEAGHPWQFTRSRILRYYSHPDCTNLYQNMGFTLIALLYGGGDFRETVRLGLACGYDTDCICATAASVIGAIRGAEALLREDGLTDTGLQVEIDTRRKDGSIRDLAEAVCAAGMTMADVFDGASSITDRPAFQPIPTKDNRPPFTIRPIYEGDPVLLCDAEASVGVEITWNGAGSAQAEVRLMAPDGCTVNPTSAAVSLEEGKSCVIPVIVSMANGAKILSQKNLIFVEVQAGDTVYRDRFGLVGEEIWYRIGPFFQNNRDLTHVPPHVLYGAHIEIHPGENPSDVVRDYHLSAFADIHHPFVKEAEPFTAIPEDGRGECVPQRLSVREDYFDLADIQDVQGPHTDYLIRYLHSPEDREAEIVVGHTAPFQLWVNGAYVGGCDNAAWWTCENRHFGGIRLKKGENILILKCAQVSDHAGYSVMFRIPGGRMRQWEDFGSYLRDEKKEL